jgi:hypothetical protein
MESTENATSTIKEEVKRNSFYFLYIFIRSVVNKN